MSAAASAPTVTIGLPVYNGGEYLESSIESLLGQTYRDFELVISDNASTDGTEAVCRAFAGRDSRVVYTRLAENIGGVANHTRVLQLARGKYFMWASSDDLWQPTYVERCCAVLDADPSVVVAYSINAMMDEKGAPRGTVKPGSFDSPEPVQRFRELVDIYRSIEPFYGLMRTEVVRNHTAPLTKHPGFDRIMFAEIGLLGRLKRVDEPLYCRRLHEKQSVKAYPSLRSRYRWINPQRSRRFVWPHFEYAARFTAAALRSAPGLRAKLGCMWVMVKWCNWHRGELMEDLAGKE
jgi:glycosyltransferase involved in cell wall biosynthesis